MSDNNSTPLSAKPALLGLTLDELTAVAVELGLPRFVGKQLCGWIYDKHARSFDEMTNLSKAGVRVLHDRPTGLHGATHRGRYIESSLFAART